MVIETSGWIEGNSTLVVTMLPDAKNPAHRYSSSSPNSAP
jgi:hypothetical protein